MDSEEIRELRFLLIRWGKENFREYPWRQTRDPYRILIAEILLHRTRAEQVIPLYENFIQRFPSIQDIYLGNYEEIKQILASAGLFWRIELIKWMIEEIVQKFQGQVPQDRNSLLGLPGVGPYIASAVRCFAWGIPEVIADTNTVRITGRVCGIGVSDNSRRNKKFHSLMKDLLDREHPREFNYAMLDLGALICMPRIPLCEICSINHLCAYGRRQLQLNI